MAILQAYLYLMWANLTERDQTGYDVDARVLNPDVVDLLYTALPVRQRIYINI